MDPVIKKAWVGALRSGKYTQGRHALRETVGDKVTHCCLGVLCELAAEANVVTAEEQAVDDSNVSYAVFGGDSAFLPASVMDWSGVDHPKGGWLGDECDTLTGLNDSGHTFAEIADIIEQYF